MSGHGRWYDPADRWPKHDKPWFRDALAKARLAGWHFKSAGGSGHIFGIAYCRRTDGDACCKFPVFSTGTAGESAASELVRRVEQCTHTLSDVQGGLLGRAAVKMDKVDRLLVGAGRLVDQAESRQDATEAWARATELLDAADMDAGEVDDLMAAAADAESAARLAGDGARQALLPLGLVGEPPGLILDCAADTTEEVRKDLEELSGSNRDVGDLAMRVTDARGRIAELRGRIASRNPGIVT